MLTLLEGTYTSELGKAEQENTDGEMETILVMRTYVEQFDVYFDPGVLAWDNEDGNLTNVRPSEGKGLVKNDDKVSVHLLSSITSMIWIRSIKETEVRRQVFILNPCRETLQEDEGYRRNLLLQRRFWRTQEVVCSRNGICGLDLVVEEEVVAVKAPEPPNITLLGPKRIEINQYEVYKVCGAKLAGESCDGGREAIGKYDGLITAASNLIKYLHVV